MPKEREVDRIIAFLDDLAKERDKYKKAFEDLKEWVKKEEKFHGVVGDSDHDFGKGCLKETYKIEIGGETIDFPKD
jgi:hypothetical protein